ncbi:hypothetical protein FB45DRAFT_919014 [Roridomyces roridus]|uniref:Uncharacterized protein n=1 Tax=Roridomyces roridus TaxID=1738132 RepID=A0AAD7FK34_9AGAR|nr:hypothetical protein FB45DRAFT_919014 [Roridomyces roridus]
MALDSDWRHENENVLDAHAQLTSGHYKDADSTPFFHKLIAGAAAYEAAKAYEKYVEKEGQPVSHEQAEKLVAGLAEAWVDELVENKLLRPEAAYGAKHYTEQEAQSKLQ